VTWITGRFVIRAAGAAMFAAYMCNGWLLPKAGELRVAANRMANSASCAVTRGARLCVGGACAAGFAQKRFDKHIFDESAAGVQTLAHEAL